MEKCEITVQVFNPLEQAIKILENQGFVFIEKFTVTDNFFASDNIYNLFDYKKLMENSFLIRDFGENVHAVYKNKNYVNGDAVSEEKVKCTLESSSLMLEILNKAGFSPWCTMVDNVYEYKKDNISVFFEYISANNKLFLEIEEYQGQTGTTAEKLHELKQIMSSLKLDIGDDYFCKKAYMIAFENKTFLSPLGIGSAFNIKENNNSYIYHEQEKALVIDCGESVFKTLKKRGILDKYKTYFLITHTHGDHVGSLGTALLYLHLATKNKGTIIVPNNKKFIKNIIQLLKILGLPKNFYNIIKINKCENLFNQITKIEAQKVKHVEELISYAYKFNTPSGNIYYTGDCKDFNYLNQINQDKEALELYIDCAEDNFKAHFNTNEIENIFKNNKKIKIIKMHV